MGQFLQMENKHQPVASRSRLTTRLLRSAALGAGIIGISLVLGMAGYMGFEGMSAVDAFVNAAMILSGMGPVGMLTTTGGKIFAGVYAIFSGILIIGVAGVVFAPLFHRFLHRFHVEEQKGEK